MKMIPKELLNRLEKNIKKELERKTLKECVTERAIIERLEKILNDYRIKDNN